MKFLSFSLFFFFILLSISNSLENTTKGSLNNRGAYKKIEKLYPYWEDYNLAIYDEVDKLYRNFEEKYNLLNAEEKKIFIEKIKERLKRERGYIKEYYNFIESFKKKSDNPDYKTYFPFAIFKQGSRIDENLSLSLDIIENYPQILEGRLPNGFSFEKNRICTEGPNMICKPFLNGFTTLIVLAENEIDGSDYINEKNLLDSPILEPFLICEKEYLNELFKLNKISDEQLNAMKSSFFIRERNNKITLNPLHNGYIFGGNKIEDVDKSFSDKKYLSQDCSGFIFEKITGHKKYLTGRNYTGIFFFMNSLNNHISEKKEKKDRFITIDMIPFVFKMQKFFQENNYHIIELNNFNEIKKDDILVWRHFKNDQDVIGSRGHIGVVTELEEDENFQFMSLGRSYPRELTEAGFVEKIMFFFKGNKINFEDKSLVSGYITQKINFTDLKNFKILALRKENYPQADVYSFDILENFYKKIIKK